MKERIYVASHDPAGGILYMEISQSGQLTLLDKMPLDRPAYLCRAGDTLYAVLREPFMMQSGVVRLTIGEGGMLKDPTTPQPVHGGVGCHIAAVDGAVYCANYLGGSVIRLPETICVFSGSGPNKTRQTCAHPHCVTPTPDGRYLCVNDLGTDSIYVLTKDLMPVSRTAMPAGSGPRHLVFSGEHAYCANELDCSLSVLRCEDGALRLLDTVSIFKEEGTTASAVRLAPDGTLYVSTKGRGGVTAYAARGKSLTFLGRYELPGASVREANRIGRWLLCGDEAQGRLVVFDTRAGFDEPPVCEYAVPSPWCILPA